MPAVRRHAFLSPGYNSWSLWTSTGSENITNPGTSHRALETLAFAIDKLANDGWQVEQVFVEQGNPTLILMVREEEA